MKAQITRIVATSRASIKVGDSFYTVEYQEERTVPTDIEVDIVEERESLWETVNAECDNQIADIIKTFKK